MRPAERAMGQKESEDWVREIRESYLCREVVKAQCAVIEAARDVPDDLFRIRTGETFDLAKLFYLDSADAWTVWIALSPANEGKAPYILGTRIFASPPLVTLNKGPDGAIWLMIAPNARTPRNLTRTIDRYRDEYATRRDVVHWVLDGRTPQETAYSLRLMYGPDRQRIADKAFKAKATVNTDLVAYRKAWESRNGGPGVPQLEEEISQFHFRDKLAM